MCKQNGKRIITCLIRFCCSVLIAVAVSQPVYAQASGLSSSGFGSAETQTIGRIVRAVAFSGGGLGIAWSAIQMATGNDQSATRAKSRIIMIVVATAAVVLLPAVINAAKNFTAGTAWTPPRS